MAKTKLEKIAGIEEEILQLTKQKKELQQQHNEQERKARNHRLCKRGGMWESLMPETITLTDEQFKIFLEKTITTDDARRIIDELKVQNAGEPVESQDNNTTIPIAETALPEPVEPTRHIATADNAYWTPMQGRTV